MAVVFRDPRDVVISSHRYRTETSVVKRQFVPPDLLDYIKYFFEVSPYVVVLTNGRLLFRILWLSITMQLEGQCKQHVVTTVDSTRRQFTVLPPKLSTLYGYFSRSRY